MPHTSKEHSLDYLTLLMSIPTTASPPPSIRNRLVVSISDITIQLLAGSRKSIQSVDVYLSGQNVRGHQDGDTSSRLLTLYPPISFSSSQSLDFNIHYRTSILWPKRQKVTISGDVFDALPQGTGKREWNRTYGKIKIILGYSFRERKAGGSISSKETSMIEQDATESDILQPATEGILRICPRFRILIIGKAIAGTSSLIKKAYGVADASIFDENFGQADINYEVYSEDKGQYIFHNGGGFEPGEDNNDKAIQNFIAARSNMPHIKDKLHAIWLCFAIPLAGDKLTFETGVKNLLKMKVEGELRVPVIGVFTKYERLVDMEEVNVYQSSSTNLSWTAITQLARDAADAKVETDCVEPFNEFAKGKVFNVKVSIAWKYAEKLKQLKKVTYDHIIQSIEEGATESILSICQRFRILVIGNASVGKTSLINEVCKVADDPVSVDGNGPADINYEICSQSKGQFVFHDSRGFEPGEDDSVKTVQNFIPTRNGMPHIRDRLHAIWLCFDIPTAGCRLLETGVENLLKMKVEGELGGVPVIGVFTKYDLLVDKEELVIYRTPPVSLNRAAIMKSAQKSAELRVLTDCVEPFNECAKGKVPHVTVSTDPKYKETLRQLIKLTHINIFEYVGEPSIASAIAKMANSDDNIDTGS